MSVGFDPRILSEGVVDILPVFFSNEPGTLERIGVQTKVFDPMDYGVASLGLTYIATREYVAKDPDAVQRFVTAVLHGIEYADANPEEALDIVMKYASQEDRDHQRFMLTTELERAKTESTRTNGFGWQTLAQWQGLQDMLLENQGIQNPVDPAKVFTDEFVRKAYADGDLARP